jgi:hypothetical protein
MKKNKVIFWGFFLLLYETIVAVKIKIKIKMRLKSKHKRMQKQKDERLITIKGCLDATF